MGILQPHTSRPTINVWMIQMKLHFQLKITLNASTTAYNIQTKERLCIRSYKWYRNITIRSWPQAFTWTPVRNGGKILQMKERGLGSWFFCRQVSRPQSHPEFEWRADRISQCERCGPNQGHNLQIRQPYHGSNCGTDPYLPANGKNNPADGYKQDPGGSNQTAGQDECDHINKRPRW